MPNHLNVIKIEGNHEPDTYRVLFGLSMKAYTVKSLREILKAIPDEAYLSDIEYRKDFKDGELVFLSGQN